ncbi:3-oxoacyl-ACP synthase III family protein [Streptomyces sp. NPDC059874]|uniref:3-oxoacyl-ACP synthase III family protein n=1 Tax=Streptomyces sp. NPDC059874 TaxID=3346983 RepID=UPI0036589594
MTTVSLVDVSHYLPGEPVPARYFTAHAASHHPLSGNAIFDAPAHRHHAARDESNVDMIERAVRPLVERQGEATIRDVDVLIVHSQLPDLPFIGAGTEVARRLGLNPEWLIDLAGGGCVSFVCMLKTARELILGTSARSALICNSQTTAGWVYTDPGVLGDPQAAIPGDGCGVAYLTEGDSAPILGSLARAVPAYAGEMRLRCAEDRKYWEPGTEQFRIAFSEAGIARVLERGNRLVPEAVEELCGGLGLATTEIDALITNQPNRLFLRTWREALRVLPERHHDTFDRCGNLFGAALPVNLDLAVEAGRIRPGDLVVFAGFAHAGDFTGAAAVRWGGRGAGEGKA